MIGSRILFLPSMIPTILMVISVVGLFLVPAEGTLLGWMLSHLPPHTSLAWILTILLGLGATLVLKKISEFAKWIVIIVLLSLAIVPTGWILWGWIEFGSHLPPLRSNEWNSLVNPILLEFAISFLLAFAAMACVTQPVTNQRKPV